MQSLRSYKGRLNSLNEFLHKTIWSQKTLWTSLTLSSLKIAFVLPKNTGKRGDYSESKEKAGLVPVWIAHHRSVLAGQKDDGENDWQAVDGIHVEDGQGLRRRCLVGAELVVGTHSLKSQKIQRLKRINPTIQFKTGTWVRTESDPKV